MSKRISLVAVVLLAVSGAPALAQDPQPPILRPLQALAGLASGLDLSDQQKGAIRAILREHGDEFAALVARERETRQALQAAIRRPEVDAAAVREASAAVAAADADLAVLRAQVFSEVWAVLEPGQRTLLTRTLGSWQRAVAWRIDAALALARGLL